jgi:hypothetical protein
MSLIWTESLLYYLLMACLLTAGAPLQLMSQNSQAAHLVEVGTHKMFLNCTGKAPGPAVILEAGTGDTSDKESATLVTAKPRR